MDKTIIFKNNVTISIKKGTRFSIVPITNLESLNVTGAKWNLSKENIAAGSSRTLRNESADDQINQIHF